jgi:homogentisate 1,2-dioxygenase
VYYEECFTRLGFDGPYSILYHANPITDDQEVQVSAHGWSRPMAADGQTAPLKRRLFDANKIPAGTTLVDSAIPLLFNRDIVLLFSKPSQSDERFFSNGDGDQLAYIYEGSGKLESAFGWLSFETGDYVWVPKGAIHRWHFNANNNAVLLFESRSELRIPKQFRNAAGQLTMAAPYSHRDFVRPEGAVYDVSAPPPGPFTVVYKIRDTFSQRVMTHSPLDIVGWDGSVYPVAFAIEKYQAKTGLVHLPPTTHATFAGDGYLICSFVPRVVDFHPQAIPCPYPHVSVDCDEVILYVRGNFTSRKGVGPGMMSYHPMGVPHGPHPGAYEKSIGSQRTDELAVMLDTFAPLEFTAQASQLEHGPYHYSWK